MSTTKQFYWFLPRRHDPLDARPLIKTLTEELKPADFAGQAWRKWVRKWQENQNDPKKKGSCWMLRIFLLRRAIQQFVIPKLVILNDDVKLCWMSHHPTFVMFHWNHPKSFSMGPSRMMLTATRCLEKGGLVTCYRFHLVKAVKVLYVCWLSYVAKFPGGMCI